MESGWVPQIQEFRYLRDPQGCLLETVIRPQPVALVTSDSSWLAVPFKCEGRRWYPFPSLLSPYS